MSDTLIDRFTVGAGKIIPVDHTGPASYTTGGETLGAANNMTGITAMGLGTIDLVLGSGSLTESGTYVVQVKQVGTGTQKTFKLVWSAATGGATGTFTGTAHTLTGTNSAPAFTGESYTPAGTNSAPTITTSSGGVSTALGVAGGALSEVSGASGITGVQAPTFSGSAHTLAGTVAAPALTMDSYTPAGTVSGVGGYAEVSPGTDLSGEVVRLAYLGR